MLKLQPSLIRADYIFFFVSRCHRRRVANENKNENEGRKNRGKKCIRRENKVNSRYGEHKVANRMCLKGPHGRLLQVKSEKTNAKRKFMEYGMNGC